MKLIKLINNIEHIEHPILPMDFHGFSAEPLGFPGTEVSCYAAGGCDPPPDARPRNPDETPGILGIGYSPMPHNPRADDSQTPNSHN